MKLAEAYQTFMPTQNSWPARLVRYYTEGLYWYTIFITLYTQITPVLGILCALLILCILKEPPRGQSEGVDVKGISGFRAYYNDIKYCIKIPSYVLTTLGFAMGTFVIGGLAQWAPLFIYKTSRDTGHPYSNSLTNLLFGVITVLGGLGGTVVGSEASKRLHTRLGSAAECYVCAASLLLGSVFAYFALTLSRHQLIISWVSNVSLLLTD